MHTNHRYYKLSALFTIEGVLVTANPLKEHKLTLTLKIHLDNVFFRRIKDTMSIMGDGHNRFRDLLFNLGLLSVYESNPDFRLQSLCGKSGFASVIIPYNGEEPMIESYTPF